MPSSRSFLAALALGLFGGALLALWSRVAEAQAVTNVPGMAGPVPSVPGQAGPTPPVPGQAGPVVPTPGQAGPVQSVPGHAGPVSGATTRVRVTDQPSRAPHATIPRCDAGDCGDSGHSTGAVAPGASPPDAGR